MDMRDKSKSDSSVIIKVEKCSFLSELTDKKRFPTVLLCLFLCTVVVLLGIFAVVRLLRINKQLPDIITKSSGVVINVEPDKEVAYFLFNSSDYWAETDISVKKGDVVSIYSSGTFTTAIHHIVNAANSDVMPPFKWSSTDGYPEDYNSPRVIDGISFKESIMNNENNGALIMKVADQSHEGYEDIYYIGKKQENVRIRHSGKLLFSLNEIYLDEATIFRLQKKYCEALKNTGLWKHSRDGINKVDYVKYDEYLVSRDIRALVQIIYNRSICLSYEKPIDSPSFLDSLDSIYADLKQYKESNNDYDSQLLCRIIELERYYWRDYKTPWFDDNLGSIFIIVEKKLK